jgi:hypothetical protein
MPRRWERRVSWHKELLIVAFVLAVAAAFVAGIFVGRIWPQ